VKKQCWGRRSSDSGTLGAQSIGGNFKEKDEVKWIARGRVVCAVTPYEESVIVCGIMKKSRELL